MSRIAGLISTLLAITFPGFRFAEGDETAPHANPRSRALMHSVRTADVRWTDGFWAERWELCRREMLPSVERALLDPANSEQLVNLKIAAGLAEGEYRGTDWSDGDCYKWLEAMALFYAVTQDPELERKLDEWIGIIAAAQSPDGYLSTNMTLRQRPRYVGPPRRYGGTLDTSTPSSRMCPAVTASKPAIMRSMVVLPQPDGPSMEKNSPRAMSKCACSTATMVP